MYIHAHSHTHARTHTHALVYNYTLLLFKIHRSAFNAMAFEEQGEPKQTAGEYSHRPLCPFKPNRLEHCNLSAITVCYGRKLAHIV